MTLALAASASATAAPTATAFEVYGGTRGTAYAPPDEAAMPDTHDAAHLKRVAGIAKDYGVAGMYVLADGELIFEQYYRDHGPDEPQTLASGTKSFTGAIAVIAAADGLLELDEKVSDTIKEWQDTDLEKVTIRQLLTLSSGLDPKAETVGQRPSISDVHLTSNPGKAWAYGGRPFQIFGELLTRKLDGESAHAYMQRRLFEPIGLEWTDWRLDDDGRPGMNGGSEMTAANWAKFGELLRRDGDWFGKEVIPPEMVAEMLTPGANDKYALGIWLESYEGHNVVQATGKGGQRCYVIDDQNLVIVIQSDSPKFKDERFMELLFTGRVAG